MRQGELLALKWRDVDLEGATLQVHAAVHYTTEGYVFTKPKTKYSRRRIALSRVAVEALRDHRTRQLQQRLAVGPAWEDLNLVFPNSIGRQIDAPTSSSTGSIPCWKERGCRASDSTTCATRQPPC